jgi:proline iminopeptidase
MPVFSAHDGTHLAYHLSGAGSPMLCLPGGPMQDSGYLGELGGLPAHRQLIMMDYRGTGQSAIPADAASYRCDRLVDDVEALREHLGLDRLDLLAPSTMAVGIAATGESRLEIARLRQNEPWFAAAFAALEAIVAGHPTDARWKAIDPFFLGRWDAAAHAYQAVLDSGRNAAAATAFGAEGAFDPQATRAALSAFDAPVLLLAGEVDLNSIPSAVAEFAALFPRAEFVVQPAAGHYPWLDDADRFVRTTARFLH